MRLRRRYNVKRIYKGGTGRLPVIALSIGLSSVFVSLSLLVLMGILDLPEENAVDFLLLAVLSGIGPIGFYSHRKLKIKRKIEEKLPDFLREVGSSTASGMTVFDAVKAASKGDYGPLTKEIKRLTAQLSWGISIKEGLINLSKRLKSPPVERAVLTINQSLDMGGNTSDTFYAAAKEIEQIKLVEMQRRSEMSMYSMVILISFFVFLAVILIINQTIFSAFFDLQSQVGNANVGGIGLGNIDKNTLKYAFYSFVFVQSIGAGLLGGFMIDGKVSAGVRYSFILALISIITLKFFM
ncbi:MAG TPA: type II secretion system F family protein [Thermoplasmatales archaeon]|nr:type II secretion system F family protein [Thermoplasmatales archaeon]